MKTTRRDFLDSIRNPAGLGATIRGLDTRMNRVERAPVKFNVNKPNPPKKAPNVPGKVDQPAPFFGVTQWGPSWSYTAGGGSVTPGDPGSLGEIPEGDAVFAFYYIFDNPDGLPSVESHNCTVTELLMEQPLPVFFPSGTPQDNPDMIVAHAIKATGSGAYFRYRFGAGNAFGWGGRVIGAGAITATDEALTLAAHDSNPTAALALPFSTTHVMLATNWGDIDAFSGGSTYNYPVYGVDMSAISVGSGVGFLVSTLTTSGAGVSLTWSKSGSMSVTQTDGYLAAAGMVVAKP